MTDWRLDTSSGVPLYVQLKQQIVQKVVQGEWRVGERLPTVRQLAVDLRINVNTVSRVYSEVEREGFIRTQQGKGTFVRERETWLSDNQDETVKVEQFVAIVLNMAHAQGIDIVALIAGLKRASDQQAGKNTPDE